MAELLVTFLSSPGFCCRTADADVSLEVLGRASSALSPNAIFPVDFLRPLPMADLTGVDVAGGWSKKGSQFKICPAYCQGFLPAGDRRSQSFHLSRGQVNGCKGTIYSAPRLSASFRVPTTLRAWQAEGANIDLTILIPVL